MALLPRRARGGSGILERPPTNSRQPSTPANRHERQARSPDGLLTSSLVKGIQSTVLPAMCRLSIRGRSGLPGRPQLFRPTWSSGWQKTPCFGVAGFGRFQDGHPFNMRRGHSCTLRRHRTGPALPGRLLNGTTLCPGGAASPAGRRDAHPHMMMTTARPPMGQQPATGG